MATVKDILGNDTLKFESQFKEQGLSGQDLQNAMINLARDTRTNRENLKIESEKKQFEGTKQYLQENDYLGDDNWLKRGFVNAGGRTLQLLNYATGNNLLSEEKSNILNASLNLFEDKKESIVSNNYQNELQKIGEKNNITPSDIERTQEIYGRFKEKEDLKKESEEAKGFIDNVKSGVNTMVDIVSNPSEWTLQGTAETFLDPTTYLGFGAGSIASKLGKTVITKGLIGASAGAGEGAILNSGIEYGIAKGSGKTDEEAEKIATQSMAGGMIIGAGMGGLGGLSSGIASKNKPNTEISNVLKDDVNPDVVINKTELKQNNALQDILNNSLLNDKNSIDTKLDNLTNGNIVDENFQAKINQNEIEKNSQVYLKNIDDLEKLSTTVHEDTKIKIKEMLDAGANIDEVISFRNQIPITQSEKAFSKIINNNEYMSNRLSGLKILNVMQDTIKSSKYSPDEVNKKLLDEGVGQELANAATRSYMTKSLDTLTDYIHSKLETNLDIENESIKNSLKEKIDFYNKQKIADDELWQSSLTKQNIDSFIDTNIGNENILPPQRDLIYELNKIGLVDELTAQKMNDKINAQYDVDNKKIAINNSPLISGISKSQALIHEYVHSASEKMLNNEKFKMDVDFLVGEAKISFKTLKMDFEQYGFKNSSEFIAEAFSNPKFAKELNSVKLSSKAKEKLQVKEYINSLWEAIYEKFSDVVLATTGKRLRINDDSYFNALNNLIKKERTDIDNIKSNIENNPIEKENSFNRVLPVAREVNIYENSNISDLQSHPRFKELIDMRKDISSEEVKYGQKVLNKGHVVHDTMKLNGEDKTFVVPTSYEKNYNADFKLTKKDIGKIQNNNIDETLLQKIRDDLYILDNHPDYSIKTVIDNANIANENIFGFGKKNNIDEKKSIEILGDDFNDNFYINSDGDLVENGKILFSKVDENSPRGKLDENINSLENENALKEDSKLSIKEKIKIVKNQEFTIIDAVNALKNNFTNIFDIRKVKQLEGENFRQKYNNAIDKLVTNAWNGLFNTAEILAYGVKYPMHHMTSGYIPLSKRWFTIGEFQKASNEVIGNYKNEVANIYNSAGEMKRALETLSKEDSQNLTRALGGDMKPEDLSLDMQVAYKSFRKMIDDNATKLVEAGILRSEDKMDNYIKRYYKQYIEKEGTHPSSLAYSELKKRKDLTHEERIALGMIEDASFVIPSTLAEQKVLLGKAKLFQDLSDTFGKDEKIDGYIKVSDETTGAGLKRYGALSGKYVHPDVFKELEYARFVESINVNAEKGLYKMIDHLKVNMTVKNPFTHIYNFGSNLSLAGIKGDLISVGKVMIMAKKNPKEFQALVSKANKYGLNTQLNDWEGTNIVINPDKKINIFSTIWKNMYMAEGTKIGKGIRNLYDWEDKIFKLAGFYNNMQKGMDEKSAFKDSMSLYVDYSTPMPSTIRMLDKSGLSPFLHYQYKSTPEVAKVMLKNPLRTLLLGAGVFSLSGFVFQNEEDKYYKPEWAGNKFNLYGIKEWLDLGNGWYLNAGRLMPGTKFDFEIGGIPNSAIDIIFQGKTQLGKDIGDKDIDTTSKKVVDRSLNLAESFLPSLTLGRYIQRAANIGLSELGVAEPKKNYYNEALTVKELLLRGAGVRRFNEKQELNTHYKKAKEIYNKKKKQSPKDEKEHKKEFDDKTKEIKSSAVKKGIQLKQTQKDEFSFPKLKF